jgi:uncharacterized protein (TIGR02246 family)
MSGTDREAVIDDLLGRLVASLRARDVQGASRLFEDDAALFGSERGESAVGRAALLAFFTRLFERPRTYGWAWERPVAAGTDDVIWFVAPASVVILGNDGSERSGPYRISAVLRRGRDGRWRFTLFSGAEPLPGEMA